MAYARGMAAAACAGVGVADERDAAGDLTEAAIEAIDRSLERLFDTRASLRAELLNDPVERATFGVCEQNVAAVLEQRLRLTELAFDELRRATSTESVNEQPLARLGIERVDLFKGYVAVALNIFERMGARADAGGEGAFVLGINAPPGTGKSTLVQILLFLVRLIGRTRDGRGTGGGGGGGELRVCQLGSDDMHMSKSVRRRHGISSRADPRALDPQFHGLLRQLRTAGRGGRDARVRLPRFNKGLDDREPEDAVVHGPFDLVLYEGYRVGVPPGDVDIPGVGSVAFDYSPLNREIDCLLYVDAGTWTPRDRATARRPRRPAARCTDGDRRPRVG